MWLLSGDGHLSQNGACGATNCSNLDMTNVGQFFGVSSQA
jgi:hypothetical protein